MLERRKPNPTLEFSTRFPLIVERLIDLEKRLEFDQKIIGNYQTRLQQLEILLQDYSERQKIVFGSLDEMKARIGDIMLANPKVDLSPFRL